MFTRRLLPKTSLLWRGSALGGFLAAGCAADPVDDGLVTWSGYVYTSPQADSLFSRSADGATGDEAVEFVADILAEDAEDAAAVEPVLATEPYEDYPGYWSVDLPPSARFTVRLSTDPVAVWRFWSPDRDASWFAGALFGADAVGVDALLTSLGESVRSLPESGLATVIGVPWGALWTGDTEALWSCADIRVAGVAPVCFSVDADGVVSSVADGPLSYFVATDVPAGDVLVESGLGAEDTYPLAAGEVGMAYWFNGSTE